MKVKSMAKITAKTALLGAAGITLIGGAWAFSGGSDNSEIDQRDFDPNTVFGAENNALEERISSSTDRFDEDVIEEGWLLKMTFMEYDGPDRQVKGEVTLSSKYARTYNYHLPYMVGQDGSNLSNSAEEADLAVARSSKKEGEPVLLANEKYEVIVDYTTNKRFVIDHNRKIIQEEPLVVSLGRPNTILADAAKKDPAAAKRLEGLLGKFTKPRLDPKREFKLVSSPNGSGKTVVLNGRSVKCSYYDFNMSGGKVGEVCYAPINAVEGLSNVRGVLMQYPLPGAGKNDTLSRLRQLAEIGGSSRFPVSFKYNHSGLDDDDYDVDFTGFNRRDLDPDAFEPPKGYRLRTMGGFFQ